MKPFLLLSCMAAACGDESLGERGDLARADVENIPAGSGVGSSASGEYELELFTRDCVGRCPVIRSGIFTVTLCDVGELDHAEVDVVQTDGALVMDAEGLVVDRLQGGIEADGAFTVGAWGTQYGGQVEVRVLGTGTVDGETFTGTAISRGLGRVEGEAIDCTASYDVTGVRR